jgi:molybdopterin molybdotransferase
VIRDSLHYPTVERSLPDALSAISAQIFPLEQQKVSLIHALARISAVSLLSSRPKPSYDQSTRDGFALSSHPLSIGDKKAVFKVIAEVAAGCRKELFLQPGEAVRIMTGGMIPTDCVRVVPFEVCNDSGRRVTIPKNELTRRQRYIRFCGSDSKEGELLVPAGTRLLPDHLLMLAENGWFDLPVYKQPKVAVLCTGSELVELGEVVQPGQKVSGNSILLSALLQAQGVCCSRFITVADKVDMIVEQVRQLLDEEPDMIITTGGMGPGKFDLMEQVFAQVGGTVVYNRLQVRPGKSTLFGMVGQTPFFGLPGPPPAVRILFHELIVPALNGLQGYGNGSRKLVDAVLESTLSLKQTGHFNLKGAVVRMVDGHLLVRPAGRMEPINAFMHLEGGRTAAKQGESVKIRLIESLHGN